MEDLIKSIQISDVAEAEEILKSAGSEDLFEKAKWNVGDTKVYQGITYEVGGFNAKGTPLWRKKKDSGNSGKTDAADNQPKKSSIKNSSGNKITNEEYKKILAEWEFLHDASFYHKLTPRDAKRHDELLKKINEYKKQTQVTGTTSKRNDIIEVGKIYVGKFDGDTIEYEIKEKRDGGYQLISYTYSKDEDEFGNPKKYIDIQEETKTLDDMVNKIKKEKYFLIDTTDNKPTTNKQEDSKTTDNVKPKQGKYKLGDTKVYQGITYEVGGFNDKGTPLWRKKKDTNNDTKQDSGNSGKTATTEQPTSTKQKQGEDSKGDGKVKIDNNEQKKQSGKKFNFNEALKKAKEIEVNPNLFNDLGKSSLMSRMFKVFGLDNKVKVTKDGFGPYKMNFFVDGEKKQGYTIYSRDGRIGSADFADCVCDCIIEELEKKKVKFDKDKINAWIFDLK